MRHGSAWRLLFFIGSALLIGAIPARGGSIVTASHASPTTIPGASPPLLEMNSASVSNDGTNLTFNITFFNTTVVGPSSGTSDAVYGFFNLDTDRSNATGVSPSALDNGPEGGFGRYVPTSIGTDAFVSLTSEGNAFGHNFIPGLVDLIRTSNDSVVATVPITYGSNPGSLDFALPVSDFQSLPGFATLQGGGPLAFSVVVGNVNNATDVLSSPSAIPEPSAILLGTQAALALLGMISYRARRGR